MAAENELELKNKSSVEKPGENEVMETALLAGHILLENGAEISRVEETFDRICAHYGVRSGNAFVLSNGIFTTVGDDRERYYAKVQHIPVSAARFHRVAAVNQLSREMETGKYTVGELREALERVKTMPGKRNITQIAASGIGSAAFCLLFGGDIHDAAAAFAVGLVLYIYILYVSAPHLTKIVGNIGGGALVTLLCGVFYLNGFGSRMDYMIIGSVMPMIPGVAFTNGIMDIASCDYIAGSVRLLDAMLVFFGIAIGMGMAFTLLNAFGGGALL